LIIIAIPETLKEWTASNTKQCKVKDWLLKSLFQSEPLGFKAHEAYIYTILRRTVIHLTIISL
jgi:hypothetical protein